MIEHFRSAPEMPTPTGELLCSLCAADGGGCCITDPDLTHLSFPLSEPEWLRLLPFAALATLTVPADGDVFTRDEERTRQLAETLFLSGTKFCTPTGTPDAHSALYASRIGRPETSQPSSAVEPAPLLMPSSTFSTPNGDKEGGGLGVGTLRGSPPYGSLPQGLSEPSGDTVRASEPNHPDFIGSMRALFPGESQRIASLFPEGGRHFSLRTRRDGACVFLGRMGCRLPRRARPWYCLLFPAWVAADSLTLFLSPDCLISQKAKGPAHGIGLLEQTPSRIRELHGLLCRDWELDNSR